MVELLLHHGAELSSVDAQGQTALHLCASSGVKVCLAMLLDHGGDDLIDLQDNGGNTALHHATFNGRLDCVRLLLETAADVTIRNYEGYTAYNIASTQGHHQIGLLLYEYRDTGSGPPSANPSNLPTPNKAFRSSQPATPLPYQTPQSNAKFGYPPQQDYAYSPSSHMHDFADDHTDSPERQIRLNIQPAKRPQQAQASSLSLKVPTNPLSSMYGANGGMENIDSMGSFLPRPHTVNSPSMNKGGMHATALRGQNSARASPSTTASSVAANNYTSANPMLRGREDFIPSNLTHSGMVAHNTRQNGANGANNKSGGAITSPLSPNSEPEGLESGNGSSGYKVLPKQSGFVPPPSLR
jgi:hypothetical protein